MNNNGHVLNANMTKQDVNINKEGQIMVLSRLSHCATLEKNYVENVLYCTQLQSGTFCNYCRQKIIIDPGHAVYLRFC